MTAQVIRRPDGTPDYVVLPWSDWQRLVGRLPEAALSDEELFELAETDGGETFPAKVVDRLLAGENPVKVFREHRGLTQKELAQQAGIAPLYLSQIERGKRSGSMQTLQRLAAALRVDLDDLAPTADIPAGGADSE